MNYKDMKKILKYIDIKYEKDKKLPKLSPSLYLKIVFLIFKDYDTTAKLASYLRKPWQTITANIRRYNRYGATTIQKTGKKFFILDDYKNKLINFIKQNFEDIIDEAIPYKYMHSQIEKEKKLYKLKYSRLTLSDVVLILQDTKDETIRDILKYIVKNEEIIEYYNMRKIYESIDEVLSEKRRSKEYALAYKKGLKELNRDEDIKKIIQGGHLETIEVEQDSSKESN